MTVTKFKIPQSLEEWLEHFIKHHGFDEGDILLYNIGMTDYISPTAMEVMHKEIHDEGPEGDLIVHFH